MTIRPSRLIPATTAVAALVGGLIAAAPASAAAPPYEGSSNPNAVGTITFYNSAGAVVTSGSTNRADWAAYAVGSTYPRSGDSNAGLVYANPDPNSTPANWYRDTKGLFTPNPVTSGPSNIQTASKTKPVVVFANDDESIDDFEDNAVHYTGTGYTNVVQIRLKTSNADGKQSDNYDTADLQLDPTNHTWTQIYPEVAAPTATKTTLTSSQNPSTAGDPVTFTATESPAAAGSVQFKDGSTNLGSPVAVDSTGKATYATSSLTAGSHSVTAVFTPTDTGAYAASTSNTVTQTVNAPAAKATSTTLTASPNPSTVGSTVTLSATESPAAAGSVQFKDGSTNLGSSVAVDSSGKATTSTTALTRGEHSLSAVFTPTDTTAYTGSTSNTVTETVNPTTPDTTTTTVASSLNPAEEGKSVTFTATETPAAAGSVQFKDGEANLGPATAVDSSGKAAYTTSTLAVGDHAISAVFTPTNTGAYAASTSEVVTETVTARTADPSRLDIAAPNVVDYGDTNTYLARLYDTADGAVPVAGKTVTFYGRSDTSKPFDDLATGTTDAGGRVTFTFKPAQTDQFYVAFAGDEGLEAVQSRTVTTTVDATFTLNAVNHASIKAGQHPGIYGSVAPGITGQKVILQQYYSGAYHNTPYSEAIAYRKLLNGKYAYGYNIYPELNRKQVYQFRMYVPATSIRGAGYSTPFSVRVS